MKLHDIAFYAINILTAVIILLMIVIAFPKAYSPEQLSPSRSYLFLRFLFLIIVSIAVALVVHPKFYMRRFSVRKKFVKEVENVEEDVGKDLKKIRKALKKLL